MPIDAAATLPRCLVERLLLDVERLPAASALAAGRRPTSARQLEQARARLAEPGCEVPGVETAARYDWVRRVLDGVVDAARAIHGHAHRPARPRADASPLGHAGLRRGDARDVPGGLRLGRAADGRRSTPADGRWADVVEAHMAEGALRSLLVDGVIGGVGGVLAFLPQILILFVFLAVLEDCGYMARAAF